MERHFSINCGVILFPPKTMSCKTFLLNRLMEKWCVMLIFNQICFWIFLRKYKLPPFTDFQSLPKTDSCAFSLPLVPTTFLAKHWYLASSSSSTCVITKDPSTSIDILDTHKNESINLWCTGNNLSQIEGPLLVAFTKHSTKKAKKFRILKKDW